MKNRTKAWIIFSMLWWIYPIIRIGYYVYDFTQESVDAIERKIK